MANPKDFLQRKATEKAVERIPQPVLDAVGRAVIKAVDKAVETRWDRALERAAEAEGIGTQERIRDVTRSFSRELTALGAATGATAAAPGLGTATAASVLAAEMGWFALRSADLIMTIGAVYGRTDAGVEERRAWVLAILAFGEDAAEQFLALAGELGRTSTVSGERVGALLAGVAGGDAVTIDGLRRLNSNLAARVVTKYSTRKGVTSLGKLLPFGIGAVVGGSANWALVRALGVQSRRFFGNYHLLVTPPPPRTPPPPGGPPSPGGRPFDLPPDAIRPVPPHH